ncbi:MAG: CDP-diacylglycerol--serine O-phosphatidyltransferase [Deltaproteobacteria bacterium RBG_13_43_22]|nr:MAG: CDP-diacylglycerol--serine O-phosphatidyltransferase [Deltaproteobacteria bacterium RBG_13_43_22]
MRIKNRRNKNREDRRRGIYVLPNLVTTASLFCGFYAIISAISGNFYYAALSILVAAVLDGLDGRIARLTRTTSAFGVQYDSLSDLIAFGLAPGILVFLWALKPFNRFGWMAAFLYVVCGALRLARFNVQNGQISNKFFVGLPIPASASIVATTILFIYQIGGTGSTGYLAVLILIYVLSFLMVSNIPYPSFKGMKLGERRSFNFLVAVVLVFVLVALEPFVMLSVGILGYVLSGPVLALYRLKKKPAPEPVEKLV